jgi:hypothetical protein
MQFSITIDEKEGLNLTSAHNAIESAMMDSCGCVVTSDRYNELLTKFKTMQDHYTGLKASNCTKCKYIILNENIRCSKNISPSNVSPHCGISYWEKFCCIHFEVK